MKQLINALTFLALLISQPIKSLAKPSSLPNLRQPKVIYGTDDRYEIDSYSDQLILEASEGVAALFKKYNLKEDENGDYKVISRTFGRKFNLCSEVSFHEQLAASTCTGFLVTPTLLLTASHCLKGRAQGYCKNMRWVFGYKKTTEVIPKENIYRCANIIESNKNSDLGIDYALIELRREAPFGPLRLNLTEAPDLDDGLALIGHPSGLPIKITDNAFIRTIFEHYIKIDSDSFAGNSGSPVINKRTGLVEGILIRGEEDFQYNKERGCLEPKRCKVNECKGEDFMRLTAIEDLKEYLSTYSK